MIPLQRTIIISYAILDLILKNKFSLHKSQLEITLKILRKLAFNYLHE